MRTEGKPHTDGFDRRSYVIALGLGAVTTVATSIVAATIAQKFGGPAILLVVLNAPFYVSGWLTGNNVHSSYFVLGGLAVGAVMWSVITLPVVRYIRRRF